ncbi:uncharacterized protein TNCV_2622271 [Trichonephila clavipes]|uniref:Uncharacterized protein n=1 Tax=Trichonephila clavipes TaxID=2585209 RepID=A0A8X6WC18_TRICX|nr:uncharacterized protein TNCV_2622271 [Trichonephila clavipes]
MHKEEKCFVKERKKKKTSSKSPVEKVTRKKQSKNKTKTKQKNIANLLSATAESPSEYIREYRARKKTLQNTLLMLSLRDGNAIETLLMTAQINRDLMNHSVPLTTEPSTTVMRVGTDTCKSIINSILRYKKTMIPIKMLTKIFKSDSLIIVQLIRAFNL